MIAAAIMAGTAITSVAGSSGAIITASVSAADPSCGAAMVAAPFRHSPARRFAQRLGIDTAMIRDADRFDYVT